MEKSNKKFANLTKAIQSLERSVKKYSNPPAAADQEDLDSYVTTLVKRFELTHEMLWKFFKAFLQDEHGMGTLGSKDVFRRCFEYKLVTDEEVRSLMAMIEDRNTTAHNYDQESANALCKKVVDLYFSVLQNIYKRIQDGDVPLQIDQ